MPHVKLTDRTIAGLKPQPGERSTCYFDAISRNGFGIDVSCLSKRWFTTYRRRGKTHRIVLGRYPDLGLKDARQRAVEVRTQAEEGLDPLAEKKVRRSPLPETDTVRGAYAAFLDGHVRRHNRRPRLVEQSFEHHILPLWQDRGIREVTRKDVLLLADHLVMPKPKGGGLGAGANRVLAHLSKFMNWCVDRAIIDASPAHRIPKPVRERRKDRVLTDGELRFLWQALETATHPWGIYVKVLLLTAQRRGEVAEMRWSHLDLDKALWRLPGDAVKAGRAHEVPLAPAVVELLTALRRYQGCDYVFTTTGHSPVSGFSKMLRGLQLNAGVVQPEAERWTLHDLRRTAATNMGSLGVPPHVIAKVLNHADNSVTAIYVRSSYLQAKRQALTTWGDHLLQMVVGAEGGHNVIPLRAGVQHGA